MNQIKNIIFDMGGVLVGLDVQRCVDAFTSLGAGSIAHYVQEHLTEDLFLDIETGAINQKQFCDKVRLTADIQCSDEKIVWAWNQLLTGIPSAKKAHLLQLRRQGYHLFLLSNTNVMHWNYCVRDFFDDGKHTVNDYFEKCFLSYQMQLVKPSEEIYRSVLDQTGIQPSETVFIDDTKVNLEGAAKVGLKTFHDTNEHSWLALLGNFLESDNR
ncbi:MAG: HAD family phosphatase [Prevotella sp.]|jgi:putative hydrolase of the HAD superfamily|uniref:HAD family phosphatase n=1 Tax=Segatella cerevisiae TaxID=2053716 RepID=A0ABT1BZC3_9BACT|nr:HAD family phosphatase [Segatella cerevisiae]MCH3994665.1 HAD family phosphatase [Prevotella sp.]MCI1246500.1 HAD family phosphatase [Prevotella sp.]MCO6025578.1 HAD family phosphatase [Segatella cerevisiae]